MSEYVLPKSELDRMKYKYDVAKEIDDMITSNNMTKPYNPKITIKVQRQHIPVIDELMLCCIEEIHGPNKGEK